MAVTGIRDDLNAAAGGFIQYGNFRFPDACTETTGCVITPQLDPGKRTVTHSVFEISLRTYLTGTPTDANVQEAIAELQRAGQPFRYQDHGRGI